MIYWRLIEDRNGLLEGCCIKEEDYKKVFYIEKMFFEPITEDDRKDMSEVKNNEYCKKHNLAGLWFWREEDDNVFKQKINGH